jgi:hypothetical protein
MDTNKFTLLPGSKPAGRATSCANLMGVNSTLLVDFVMDLKAVLGVGKFKMSPVTWNLRFSGEHTMKYVSHYAFFLFFFFF